MRSQDPYQGAAAAQDSGEPISPRHNMLNRVGGVNSGSMLGQRMASFRMTREEQLAMSSKNRTWR